MAHESLDDLVYAFDTLLEIVRAVWPYDSHQEYRHGFLTQPLFMFH